MNDSELNTITFHSDRNATEKWNFTAIAQK